ncbi:MAG: hypothetical protein RLZZ618_2744 [Pseudomonadota bacterium]|jgi:hypothetical protein
MLVRLMYASRAADSVTQDELAQIMKRAKADNPAAGITGVLCFSAGVFLQVLEGGRASVNALYNRIAQDRRHSDVTLLSFEEIGERSFACWSMGQVNLSRINPGLLLKYSETAVLDPFAVSGAVSMALFEELMATASIVGQA